MFVIEGNLDKNTVGWQATSWPIQATQGLLSNQATRKIPALILI